MSKRIRVRPGKSESKMGFVMGIIFCFIGLFVVIPSVGLFGILWTAIAGWITYTNYRNGFTDNAIDSQIIEIDEDDRNNTYTSHSGYRSNTYDVEPSINEDEEEVEDRLKKLRSLYEKSLITREEYEEKRKDILDEL